MYFENTTHLSRVAKSMRKTLLIREIDVPLTKCQEALAKMTGYADWHELARSVGSSELPSIPDELAPIEMRAARRSQYVAVLQDGGIPLPVAHALVDELSPTRHRSSGSDYEDVEFLLREHPGLAQFDFSLSAIAAQPGLLNLLRRVHNAVSLEPYWPEKASWRAFKLVDPAAVELVSGLRRNIAHTWWGPAIARTLADRKSRFDAAPHGFAATMEAGGAAALSRMLAKMDRKDFMTVVANLSDRVGVKVLEAASRDGRINRRFVEGQLHSWFREAWTPPAELRVADFGGHKWSLLEDHLFLPFGLHEHDFVKGGLYCRAIDDLNYADYQSLRRDGSKISESEIAEFVAGGARFVMIADEQDGSPVAGGFIRRKVDLSSLSYQIEYLGTFIDPDFEDLIPLAEIYKIYAASIGLLIYEEIDNWQELLPPGSIMSISFKDRSPTCRNAILPTLLFGLEGLAEIAGDEGDYVRSSVVSRLGSLPKLESINPSKEERGVLPELTRLWERTFYLNVDRSLPLALVAESASIAMWHGDDFHKWGRFPAHFRGAADVDKSALAKLIKSLGKKCGFSSPCIIFLPRGGTFMVEREDYRGLAESRATPSTRPVLISTNPDTADWQIHELIHEFPCLAAMEV